MHFIDLNAAPQQRLAPSGDPHTPPHVPLTNTGMVDVASTGRRTGDVEWPPAVRKNAQSCISLNAINLGDVL
jgi:hypothetical protein